MSRNKVFAMATNHYRTLYKDDLSALLGKEAAEEQVRILNAQTRKSGAVCCGFGGSRQRKG